MLQVKTERLLDQFLELVKVDSETKFEATISKKLKEIFESLGLEVEEDQASDHIDHEANNLIFTLPANRDGVDPIYFTCHMDTVTPGVGIQPSIQDGYVISDGTTILGADDKAGIAAMIEAIHVLQETNMKHGMVQFVITVGEESGLAGAKVIDQSLMKAKFGYALDSDGPVGNIVTSAPYQAHIKAKVFGKSAHAGVAPEKGISAITLAAKAIAKMKLGRIDEETTANIGYFKGGKETQTNVVVDYAEIVAEARSLNGEKLEAITAQMEEAFQSTVATLGGDVEVSIEQMYPGFQMEENSEVVQVAKSVATSLELPFAMVHSGGGSDANIFNGHGIPTGNLSVGYEFIHTTKERIPVEQLEKLTTYILHIMKHVAER
ncbi:M20/M25/M40 family metallo-hydrolase [Pseudogracilibacillus sp. ICA-222130]|uniref:M20/M25/M40 family metallo-hydrolase n=1 Tax=Pseudogracilibacillus sp. ICA-222130 TaxID=3134655 RepID=UPI0030BE16A8